MTATAISTGFPVGATPGSSQSIGVVGETDHELVHHLIMPDGARHARHLHVRRKELADKMIERDPR
jgi:hypothetical protein